MCRWEEQRRVALHGNGIFALGVCFSCYLHSQAIRMIKDLGLHLNSAAHRLSEDLEPDDLEARKRLFLSAYAWDKSISLCLGRPPSLTEMPYSPSSLLDDSGDSEPWTPFYLGEGDVTYPPTPALTTLSFISFCQLSMVPCSGPYPQPLLTLLPDCQRLLQYNIYRTRSWYQSPPSPVVGEKATGIL